MTQVLSERQGHTYPAPVKRRISEKEGRFELGFNSSNWEIRNGTSLLMVLINS